MTTPTTRQSTQNMAYVRRLLSRRQPGFSAALELAIELAELDFCPPQLPRRASAGQAHGR